MVSYGATDSTITEWKDALHDRMHTYSTRSISGKDMHALVEQLGSGETRTVFLIRPSRDKETSGMDASIELARGVYKLGGNHSFEIWHGNRNRFIWTVSSDVADKFRKVFSVFFPNAELVETDLEPTPSNQEYVSAIPLTLRNDYFLQILNPLGATQMTSDPYEDLLGQMNALPDSVRTVFQIAFTPGPDGWTNRTYVPLGSAFTDSKLTVPLRPRRFSVDRLADEMVRKTPDSNAPALVRSQTGDDGFVTSVRVLAFAPDAGQAKAAAMSIGECISGEYDDPQMNQGIMDYGIPRLKHVVKAAAERRIIGRRELVGKYKRRPMTLTVPELASLAHIPSTVVYDDFYFEGGEIEWKESTAKST